LYDISPAANKYLNKLYEKDNKINLWAVYDEFNSTSNVNKKKLYEKYGIN
jgi:hypothetical protein